MKHFLNIIPNKMTESKSVKNRFTTPDVKAMVEKLIHFLKIESYTVFFLNSRFETFEAHQ
jgi:acetylornithine/succinyldiaminopimelate/putrescine aminotransferase